MALSDLNIRIKANLDNFSSAMQNAQRKLKKFEKNMSNAGKSLTKNLSVPIAGIAAATLTLSNQSANFADNIDKMSIRTGLARDTLQEMQFIADQSGVEFQAFEQAVSRLTRSMADADYGLKRQKEAFEKLGISVRDSDGNMKKIDEVFPMVISKLSKMSNETERNALATEVFGKSAFKLVPLLANLGDKGIEELTKKAHELGIIMSDEGIAALVEYKDKMSQLKMQFQSIGRTISVSFADILTKKVIPYIQEKTIPAIKDWVDNLKGLDVQKVKSIAKIAALVAAIGPALLLIGKLAAGIKAVSAAFTFLAANPIGIVITLVGLLAIAVVKIIKNWDKIKVFFTKLWLNLKLIFLKGVKALLAPLMFVFDKLGIEMQAFNKLDDKIAASEKKLADFKKAQVDVSTEVDTTTNAVIVQSNNLNTLGKSATAAKMKIEELSKAKVPEFNNMVIRQSIKKATGSSFSLDDLKNIDVSGLNQIADASNAAILPVQSLQAEITKLSDLSIKFGELLRDSLINALSDFGETLGRVLVGDASPGELGRGLLESMANFAKQFGAMLLAEGIAVEAFKTSLESLNGIPAIAAGLGLLAAAGAITGYLNKTSGEVSSGSSGFGSSSVSDLSNQKLNVSIYGELAGDTVRLSNKRSLYINSRITKNKNTNE